MIKNKQNERNLINIVQNTALCMSCGFNSKSIMKFMKALSKHLNGHKLVTKWSQKSRTLFEYQMGDTAQAFSTHLVPGAQYARNIFT